MAKTRTLAVYGNCIIENSTEFMYNIAYCQNHRHVKYYDIFKYLEYCTVYKKKKN